jgi:hypothetical protein
MDKLVHNSWGQRAYPFAKQRKSATVKKLNGTQLKNKKLSSGKKKTTHLSVESRAMTSKELERVLKATM